MPDARQQSSPPRRTAMEELVWCAEAVVAHWRHDGLDDADGCLTVLLQYLEAAVQGLSSRQGGDQDA